MQTTKHSGKRAGPASGARPFIARLKHGDEVAYLITFIFAASIILITSGLVYELYVRSAESRLAFGWHFLTGSTWDPVALQFGALPFIYGTVVTSALALIIGVP